MIALFSDWVGNRAILAAIIVSTAVNAYLAIGMLNDLPSSQQFFNTLHPYWVQPLVTLIFALAAYLAEACLRTAWAKRTSAWLHRALHGQDDLEKVSWTFSASMPACSTFKECTQNCQHHQVQDHGAGCTLLTRKRNLTSAWPCHFLLPAVVWPHTTQRLNCSRPSVLLWRPAGVKQLRRWGHRCRAV